MATLTRSGWGNQTARKQGVQVELRGGLQERLRQEGASIRGTQIGFMDWALKVPEPKAGRLDFDLFPFQKELYEEGVEDREVVIKKSTQVGVSSWGIRWAMYHTDTRGRTGLYVFPTARDVYDFSAARIRPVIDASEYLTKRIPGGYADNMGLKRIGLGFLYFRGSESKRGLDSVDADHIVFDEYDTLDHENIPDAERRISAPTSAGLLRRLGVPSIPEWGIAKEYALTDQRQWHIKCGSCNERQPITFKDNVDQKQAIRICRKCAKSIEPYIAGGEWVAEFPERSIRGYHVTRLIAPTQNIPSIIKQSKKKSPTEKQVFFNKDLGEEYAPAEGRLSRQAIAAAQSAGQGYRAATTMSEVIASPPSKLRTMGIDVATTRNLNVRVSEHLDDGRKIALFIGEVESFEDLVRLMNLLGIHMAVIDHLPEGRLARAFAERFPGRAWLVALTGHTKQAEVIKIDDDNAFVSVRKTAALDATFELVRSQQNLLPIELPEGYAEQMMAPVRTTVEDQVGNKVQVYRSVGPDDYALAEAYDTVASDLADRAQILVHAQAEEFEQLDDMVDFERSDLRDYGGVPDYYGGREDR